MPEKAEKESPENENVNEHFPGDGLLPNPETKDMEVHHHSHAHGKKMDALFMGVFHAVPRCVLWIFSRVSA